MRPGRRSIKIWVASHRIIEAGYLVWLMKDERVQESNEIEIVCLSLRGVQIESDRRDTRRLRCRYSNVESVNGQRYIR